MAMRVAARWTGVDRRRDSPCDPQKAPSLTSSENVGTASSSGLQSSRKFSSHSLLFRSTRTW